MKPFQFLVGGCRRDYVNNCLAHLISMCLFQDIRWCLFSNIFIFIEGSIFWCYGLMTFGRFLGSFADIGWAWNRLPSEDHYTAEFVESFVIFLYGATNTWMERFDAKPGDPFTTKQIQHISIAVRISIFLQDMAFSKVSLGHVLFCWSDRHGH